ncbi:hypothetical protein N7456_013215 [Penicillium angulare]|uniref:Uncharacterized protein n=1 Tax=Penicillium angulare TaxID=116970 RepID=A0A9W9JW61_9EURO|nr:hypothetical protein N7456_013215 [Penicillium angulare]
MEELSRAESINDNIILDCPEGRKISQAVASADGRDQPASIGESRGAPPPHWKESEAQVDLSRGQTGESGI